MSATEPEDPDLYRLVIEGTEDFAIILIDPHGRISLWNTGAERILGFPAEEMIGQDAAVIFTPEDRASGVPEREVGRARQNGRAADVRWHIRKGGGRFFADGVLTALYRDGALAGFAKILSDATERHLSEQRLALEIELQSLLSSEASREEIVTRVLERVSARFGWSAGVLWERHGEAELACAAGWHGDQSARTLIEKLCESPHPNSDHELAARVWDSRKPLWAADVIDDGTPPSVQLAREAGLPFGFAYPLCVSDRVLGVFQFFSRTDWPPREEAVNVMTVIGAQVSSYLEQRRTNEQLAETRESHRVIAETAQDAIFTIDETSTILFANSAAEQLFGYEPGELQGRRLDLIMPERYRTAHQLGLNRYVTTGKRNIPWAGVELPGLHRDGTEIPLEIAFGQSVEGGRRLFTGFARDIRERKRIEADKARLLAEARAANQSKDLFLAIVSHELRTPMTSILGWIEILEEDRGDDKTFRMALEMIRNSAGMQAQLIEDILDVSRIVLGKLRLDKRDFDLSAVVHAALQSLTPSAEPKKIQLIEQVEPGISIFGDPGRLQQVVWNLLSNAIKFTPEGGTVSVQLRTTLGGDAELTVADTGPGISAKLMDQLFDPFRQTEEGAKKGGLGLGLSIVKQIVDLHGGDISVERDGTGTGATLTVRLPGRGAK